MTPIQGINATSGIAARTVTGVATGGEAAVEGGGNLRDIAQGLQIVLIALNVLITATHVAGAIARPRWNHHNQEGDGTLVATGLTVMVKCFLPHPIELDPIVYIGLQMLR